MFKIFIDQTVKKISWLDFFLAGRHSSVGIATRYGLEGPGIESRRGEIFRTYPDRLWGPPSLLYNGYRVFPGGKRRPERDADHTPPSSAEVKKELSYNSTHPMGPPGPVTGFPLPFTFTQCSTYVCYINNDTLILQRRMMQ